MSVVIPFIFHISLFFPLCLPSSAVITPLLFFTRSMNNLIKYVYYFYNVIKCISKALFFQCQWSSLFIFIYLSLSPSVFLPRLSLLSFSFSVLDLLPLSFLSPALPFLILSLLSLSLSLSLSVPPFPPSLHLDMSCSPFCSLHLILQSFCKAITSKYTNA